MANTVSLLQYLQLAPPPLPVVDPSDSSKLTTNTKYDADDILHLGVWDTYNITNVMQRYGAILTGARIDAEPMPTSMPQAINSKEGVRVRFVKYFDSRVARALRCTFSPAHMPLLQLQEPGHPPLPTTHVALSFAEGDYAITEENFIPDKAYFLAGSSPGTSVNRAPGEIKPSYEWQREFQAARPKQFKQALSKLNFYMKQNHTRYGFMCTDKELTAVRRMPQEGHLELSATIKWSQIGDPDNPSLTVLLALWYIGMLAADGNDWQLP